jgi:uncharacterized membrane protein
MSYEVQIFLLLATAVVSLFAAVAVLMKEHRAAAAAGATQFGVSTEGEKRCPACGMGNLWMDRNCISCGKRLPG